MENIYAALLLHKAGKDISEANLMKVLAAAGAESDESQVKSLVVSLKGVDIEKELESATLAAAAPASGASASATKKEEAPKEEKHEEAAEGLSALFG
ncbi:MAG: 50S ribosomal protein L12 [Nanoarchaeota archaeon]|nr:50S ribosomal protein L12 [Nanoarchaeota archaeon]